MDARRASYWSCGHSCWLENLRWCEGDGRGHREESPCKSRKGMRWLRKREWQVHRYSSVTMRGVAGRGVRPLTGSGPQGSAHALGSPRQEWPGCWGWGPGPPFTFL